VKLTNDLEGSGGCLFAVAEDFLVDEELAYAPSGEGEHLFLRIEKRNLTTIEAVKRLAGKSSRDAGVAGNKDKHAIATQWISIPLRLAAPIPVFEDSADLRVLEAKRHAHKLRRGHQRGNRFRIAVREVPAGGIDRAQAILDRLRSLGVPNRFGAQRFGIDGDNADRARAFLRGTARAPRDRRVRDLMLSALQSEVFNRIVDLRIERDLWMVALPGDVMTKHATGGMFTVVDAEAETPRVAALEISPTGLLPGKRTEIATDLEREALGDLSQDDLQKLGPGTRRTLRYPLDPTAAITALGADAYQLDVTLPSGAFATVLLDELGVRARPDKNLRRDEGSSSSADT
jgi:tRNA pseudouridine13 synthase